MIDNLKYLLTYITPFDEAELEKISSCFKPKTVKRNTALLRQGDVCKEFYFVDRGAIRTYFIDKKGDEKTRLIISDCSIGTALASFVSQEPSFEFIEAIERTDLLSISYRDFYHLLEESTTWKNFYVRILEMAYSFQNKKIESLVTLDAKQRYQQLLDKQPALTQRLSNKLLASYLDVKPETLSRLKSS